MVVDVPGAGGQKDRPKQRRTDSSEKDLNLKKNGLSGEEAQERAKRRRLIQNIDLTQKYPWIESQKRYQILNKNEKFTLSCINGYLGNLAIDSGGNVSDVALARNCCLARMLPGEAELVSEWTGLPGEAKSVKRFERSNGLDTALYKNYLYLFM